MNHTHKKVFLSAIAVVIGTSSFNSAYFVTNAINAYTDARQNTLTAAVTNSSSLRTNTINTPGNFKVVDGSTSNTDNKITLSWQDTSTNETGFEILKSTSASFSNPKKILVAPNTSTWDDRDIAIDTSYFYKIRTRGLTSYPQGYTYSSYTHSIEKWVPKNLPPAPSNVKVRQSGSSVVVSWTDNSLSEKQFGVDQSVDGTTWTILGTAPENATTFTASSPQDGATRYYRVAALNSRGLSKYSNTTSLTATKAAAPSSIVDARPLSALLNAPIISAKFRPLDDDKPRVRITWDSNNTDLQTKQHLNRYEIYKIVQLDAKADSETDKAKALGIIKANPNSFRMQDIAITYPGLTDTNVQRKQTYFYTMRTVFNDGSVSGFAPINGVRIPQDF